MAARQRVRLHPNGRSEPKFIVTVPASWEELIVTARHRFNVTDASTARPLARLFVSADGAEVGSLEDMQEGDVIAVSFDGCPFEPVSGAGVPATPASLNMPPESAADPPPPARRQAPSPSSQEAAAGTPSAASHERALRGVRRGVELLTEARALGDAETVCEVLQQLAQLPQVESLTALLSESGVGTVVAPLQRSSDAKVARMARKLVAHWKGLVDDEARHTAAALQVRHPPPPHHHHHQEPPPPPHITPHHHHASRPTTTTPSPTSPTPSCNTAHTSLTPATYLTAGGARPAGKEGGS
jgi:hypothetical protein